MAHATAARRWWPPTAVSSGAGTVNKTAERAPHRETALTGAEDGAKGGIKEGYRLDYTQ